MAGDGFAAELGLIAFLILLNGFFAGAEIAVISARASRLRPLADRGDRRAAALLRLKSDPDRFLATVQIGVTVLGTLASAVGGVAAVERLEPAFAAIPIPWVREAAEPLAVGGVVCLIAYASLVIGELVPKSLAIRHADTLALVVARPIEWLSRATRAAVAVLTASTGIVLRLIGQKAEAQNPFHTLEDVRALVWEAEEQGLVAGGMVRGVFEIQDRPVRTLMTPRARVVGIPAGAALATAVRIATQSGYSRFPAYEGDLDNVQGVVVARELYEAALAGRSDTVAAFMRPGLVVPEVKQASELLAEMRRARTHMAVLVDEHGSFQGVVTLEDLFAVIVGNVEAEREAPEERVRFLGAGVLVADASLAVGQLNGEHKLVLPESDNYVTLAGLVLERLGSIPKGGEQVEVAPYRLTVVRVAGRRIVRVRIERVREVEPASN